MFTIISEPSFLEELRSTSFANVLDTQMELIPFLKEQYNYEVSRSPTHRMFESHYQLKYFDASHMLNYYMCAYGKGNKEQYAVDSESPTEIRPVIYKRTLN